MNRADPRRMAAPERFARRILLVLEEPALSDLLAEALVDAGHVTAQVDGVEAAEAALRDQRFETVVVDLDTRARDGLAFIARLATTHPTLTVVALLPCGGLASELLPLCHAVIEKPARLAALLSAVRVTHRARSS